jgi:hypothetical protein
VKAASPSPIAGSERLAYRRDIDAQIDLFDEPIRPDRMQQLVLADEFSAAARENEKEIERLPGQRDGPVLSQQQPLARNQKKIAKLEARPLRHARSAGLGNFQEIFGSSKRKIRDRSDAVHRTDRQWRTEWASRRHNTTADALRYLRERR